VDNGNTTNYRAIDPFSAGEVRKSLRSSGIPGVDSGNTTFYRAIEPLFLQVKYGSLSGHWSSGFPGVDSGNTTNYRALDPFFLQVKYGSLSGVAEFRVWMAEILLIIELLTLFFCR
jgi:hypothetical protein